MLELKDRDLYVATVNTPDEAYDARENAFNEVKTIFKDKWVFNNLYDFNVRSEWEVRDEFCERLCREIGKVTSEKAQINCLVNMYKWAGYLYDELQEWVDDPDAVKRWYEDKFGDAYKGNMERKPKGKD